MDNESEKQQNVGENIPTVTPEEIMKALADSSEGATQLNDQLREVFALSDTSATLRLR